MAHSPWDAELYDDNHSFVWKLTANVLKLLDPRADERIIDLGCGTGHLAQELASRGVDVVGVDSSESMISRARATYPGLRFVVADARDFDVGAKFDAVFSNAALHWMPEHGRVFARAFAHLRPGGRFVFEMGAEHNVQAILEALAHARGEIGAAPVAPTGTKTFLNVARATALLNSAGFEVLLATASDRPTGLNGPQGLRTWITMFGGAWLDDVPDGEREKFLAAAERHARPRLFRDGLWTADYRRLLVKALRPS